jgi:anti-sigma factor RsiW
MNFSDETLMAYADGELGEPERSAVAKAEREDPAVAAVIARHRKLHTDVYAAFAGVLDEPVPARLQALGGANTNGATVASLAAARERKAQAREAAAGAKAAVTQRAWPRWGALAASLAVGVLAGSMWLGGGMGSAGGGFVASDGSGRLVAQGELASALSQQLASTAESDKRVQIGVSFAAKDGGYCRSFAVGASAGLACRDGDTWRVPVLQEAPAGAGDYRQAASAAPVAVLDAIDQRIEGAALDAAAERAARDRGWKR